MPQPTGFQLRLGWSGWLALIVVVGLILAVATVVSVLLIGVLLVLLPVALIAALLYYLFPGLRYRPPRPAEERDVIEGQYRVIDPTQIERDRFPGEEPRDDTLR